MKTMKHTFTPSTPIIVSAGLIDMLRSQCGKRWRDALAVYAMYCYHAIRQGTSSVYATDKWMAKQMRMSYNTFRDVKTLLLRSKLISTHHKNDPITGEIAWYVRVKFSKSSTVQVTVSDATTHPESGRLATHPKNQVTGFETHSLIRQKNTLLRQQPTTKDKDEVPQPATPEEFPETNQQPTRPTAEVGGEIVQTVKAAVDVRTVKTNTIVQAAVGVGINSGKDGLPPVKYPEQQPANSRQSPSDPSVPVVEQKKGGEVVSGIVTRDGYISKMRKDWTDLCGVDAEHILQADLESNAKRLEWQSQADYWMRRMEGLDDSQTEAWRLIARYLRLYHQSNRSYPDMRHFLKGWWASGWQEEKTKIVDFCKAHDGATPSLNEYVEARATSGKAPTALWLMSCTDYMTWFSSMTSTDHDDGPEGMDDPAESRREEETRKRISLDLIARARVLIRAHSDDEVMKASIVELLHDYRDGNASLDELRRGIEEFERAGASTASRDARETQDAPA
jgi:hypothetical protein